MAFNKQNLTIVTNNVKAGVVPAVWFYYNESYDNLGVTDYFNEARMTVGDLILAQTGAGTGLKKLRVSAKSTDTFSATAVQFAVEEVQNMGIQTITSSTLYHEISNQKLFTNIVTSAANETDTFTTSATAGSYITFANDTITDGVKIRVSSATTLPAGLVAATDYYAVDSDTNRCRLSLTRGGASVAITDAGTGVHTATAQKNQMVLGAGYEGQRKIIKIKTDGGIDAEVIPENFKDGTIITMNDVNDAVELLYVDSKWQLIKNSGSTVS